MKWLILSLLLIGCSNIDADKAEKMAKNYCSCHKGVYFIKYNYAIYDFYVNCNDGLHSGFSYEDKVFRGCK